MRLACVGEEGWPLVLSLWYVHLDDAIWCATHSSSRVLSMLEADPRCAFEIAGEEPPYSGTRGRGRATLLPERGAGILATLLERYRIPHDSKLGSWLLSRSADEIAIRIEPNWIGSWDFTERMES
jgi:nitroimidazol reductase NimA-like FMN-containing flavoprotein (pyridoxamine 5'-phosphate oxidase superfamily)